MSNAVDVLASLLAAVESEECSEAQANRLCCLMDQLRLVKPADASAAEHDALTR